VLFAVSSATARTAGYVLAALGGLILVEVLVSVAEVNVHILGPVLIRLFIWPGPLEIFTGRWMLIDV
jgi:ascorbate-specific PTS system EIIC-type component UlaA